MRGQFFCLCFKQKLLYIYTFLIITCCYKTFFKKDITKEIKNYYVFENICFIYHFRKFESISSLVYTEKPTLEKSLKRKYVRNENDFNLKKRNPIWLRLIFIRSEISMKIDRVVSENKVCKKKEK